MKIIDRKFLKTKTRTCHASSVAFYNNEPIFAWFGGQKEGLPDSSIYIQHQDKVASLGNNINIAYWNPILFNIGEELFLSYKIGEFCDRWNTYILNISEIDFSKDISKLPKQLIPAGLNFCVKTKPIISHNDIICCGSSVETFADWTSYIESYDYLNGEFKYASRSNPITVPKKTYDTFLLYDRLQTLGIIQPSLWLNNYGVMKCFMRSSRGLGKIYYSSSGSCFNFQNWSIPKETDFYNPNSGIDTECFDDRLFLVYNPSSINRYPLVLAEIDENNFKIKDKITIQEEVDGDNIYSRELSYPFMIHRDNLLYLTYTYGRTGIEFVTIEV